MLDDIPNVDEFLTMLTSNMPMRRLGTADDIANAALFLASDRSAYTSGAIVPNAEVTLKNVATGVSMSTVSNSTGAYTLSNVPTGQY